MDYKQTVTMDPSGFVLLADFVPGIVQEIRYYSTSYDMFVSQRNELMNISFFVCIADGHPEGSLYPDPAHTVNIVSL